MAEAVHLRPIDEDDTPDIDAVLGEMDPEEADGAAEALERGESVFSAVEIDGRLSGFTGITVIDGTESAAWLSYTGFLQRVSPDHVRDAVAQQIRAAGEAGLSRLFAAEGDDAEDREQTQYLRAIRDAGFRDAIRIRDFYEPGEDGLWLEAHLVDDPAYPKPEDGRGIEVTDVLDHDEAEGVYVVAWVPTAGQITDDKAFAKWLKKARKRRARMVVASGPSDMPLMAQQLNSAGFTKAGQLSDFYAPGRSEVQYVLDLL